MLKFFTKMCFFLKFPKYWKLIFKIRKKTIFWKIQKNWKYPILDRFWENQPHHLQKSDLDDEEISGIFSKEIFWRRFYLCKTLLQNGFWPYWILMFLPCTQTASVFTHFFAQELICALYFMHGLMYLDLHCTRLTGHSGVSSLVVESATTDQCFIKSQGIS